jgi:demethylmenaquinone methyltransferase/2-methoxy-6-polyprenyl-1,4-benzoquinol methylase
MKETQQIKLMFDNIVHRYDFLNRLLSFGQDIRWRKKMAKKTINHKTQMVLDLAVGTGDSTKALLKEKIKVIGADISFEMLKIAKKKIQNNFTLLCASVYQLPFKDKTFDAVTCAFGIRNMHETENALKEIYRVIKEGGKIVILEFSLPSGFLRKPFLFYLKKVIPLIASLFSLRYAYEYLGFSIESLYKPDEFVKILKNCGFKNIKSSSLSLGITWLYGGEKF